MGFYISDLPKSRIEREVKHHELKEKSSDNLVKHVQNMHRLYLKFQCMRFARYEIRNVPHEFLLKILDER